MNPIIWKYSNTVFINLIFIQRIERISGTWNIFLIGSNVGLALTADQIDEIRYMLGVSP